MKRALRQVLALPSRQYAARPLACFALCALAGIVAAYRTRPGTTLCAVGCLIALAAIAALRSRRRRASVWILLLAFCLGMLRMAVALNTLPEVKTRYSVPMVGRVMSDPYTNPDTGRVISRFIPEAMDGRDSGLRLRLYLRGDPEALSEIAYGQVLSLKGHIWANDPVTNPYEFDFGEYLHVNGMDAIATAKIEDVEILDTRRDLTARIIDLRHAAAGRIDALFPRSAAMARALILGDRSLISEEMRESLSATGTAHLIAISGMHVTVLAMAVSLLLTRFMSRRLAGLLTLLPLLFYGALIGFSASFVRAVVMFGLFSLGFFEGLPSDPVTRLCAALLGYLALRPMAVCDAGFVLSFSASAGLLLLTPPLAGLLRPDRPSKRASTVKPWRRTARRAGGYIAGLLCASLAAQLATLPAVIAYFGVQSVVSLPFNLVCVPLCMLGYVLAMAALVVSALFYPLALPLAMVAEGLLTALTSITAFSAALPVTGVRIGRYPAPLILLHALVILVASDLCALPRDVRRYIPLLLLPLAAMASLNTWLHCMPFSVTFLDAEQADCAVLCTGGRVYVFDAGDTYTPAADYLSATALRVDGVFLSHPHQDHAGGLSDILECFRPGAIYVPRGWFDQEDISPAITEGIQRAEYMGVPIVELAGGDVVPLSGSAEVEVFGPGKNAVCREINDLSLVLLAREGDHSVLFTGDLHMTAEPSVIPDCDVLKVAHHGADNATSVHFLKASTPEIAVIQVGENSHGHPGDETLERLSASGAIVLRNDQCGAITLTPSGDGWRAKTFLEAIDEME